MFTEFAALWPVLKMELLGKSSHIPKIASQNSARLSSGRSGYLGYSAVKYLIDL